MWIRNDLVGIRIRILLFRLFRIWIRILLCKLGQQNIRWKTFKAILRFSKEISNVYVVKDKFDHCEEKLDPQHLKKAFKCMITTSTSVFLLGTSFVVYTAQSTVSIIVEYCTPREWVYTNTVGLVAL